MKYNRVGLRTKVLCSVHRIHKPVATSILQLENTSVQYPNVTRCTSRIYLCKKISKFIIHHVTISKWKGIGKCTSRIGIDTNRVSKISGLTGEELHQRTSEMYSYTAPYYDHSCYAEQQEECKTGRKFTHSPFLFKVTDLFLFFPYRCARDHLLLFTSVR
jgi:hypothetical protein